MAQQTINIGAAANDGTGDKLRIAGDKINDNFTELYGTLSGVGGSGTSFPGSPATGLRFYRTDRKIEYFYDGTRWLSTQLFTLALQNSASATATFATDIINPWASVYAIYVTDFAYMSRQTAGTTSANYFTCVLQNCSNPASPTAISGTLSAINNTLDLYEQERESTNVVVASTVTNFRFLFTEVGTATAILGASIAYRLIG